MDNSERQTAMGTRRRTKTKKKQPKHSTQKSKKMINTDPIYQEWSLVPIVVCLSELSILDK
jgi:hypothetical protein